MLVLFRSFLSKDRKRRCLAVGFALRLLRLIQDIEKDEMHRYLTKLHETDMEFKSLSVREYTVIDEEFLFCEFLLGFLDSAIEVLELM